MGPTRLQLANPVIATNDGYCVAGGLELALWCDLRVAAESAVFGVCGNTSGHCRPRSLPSRTSQRDAILLSFGRPDAFSLRLILPTPF